jgi:hypothetical protein
LFAKWSGVSALEGVAVATQSGWIRVAEPPTDCDDMSTETEQQRSMSVAGVVNRDLT